MKKSAYILGPCTLGPLSFIWMAGCVSSNTVGFVDDPALLPGYLGAPYEAWVQSKVIQVEIGPHAGLAVVVDIKHEIKEGSIYLSPLRISGGSVGNRVITVDLQSEPLPENWQDHVYWLTEECLYPIGHSAYWDRSLRKPSRRVKVIFSPDTK